jgi:UDP-N-acetylmuramate--alanine ligase
MNDSSHPWSDPLSNPPRKRLGITSQAGKAHLLGIGGAGMSPIAEVLLARGWQVSGCDERESASTRALVDQGAQIWTSGHDPGHIRGQDLFVHTSRLNPAAQRERDAASRAGARVLMRAEMLAELVAASRSIGVAGTHGKTTITAMVGHILRVAGLDPIVLVGDGRSSRVGSGDVLAAELDESDAKLPLYRPQVAVVTNVEFDHSDFFVDLQAVQDSFRSFLTGLPSQARVITCADDPWLREQPLQVDRITYGFAAGATYCVRPEGKIELAGGHSVPLRLAVPGRHNLQNAAAAVAAAAEVGVSPEAAAAALTSFAGAKRRLERLGTWRGATIYDDYGHLPAEVNVTVEAARELPHRRLILIFQPHRYSRYVDLWEQFAPPLGTADRTVVTEIFAAGETNPNGVSAAGLAARAGATFVADLEEARSWLEREVQEGDLVLLMGAGDIRRLGDELAQPG